MSNLSLNQRINNLESGGSGGSGGWSSDNLFIAQNTNNNHMGNVITYHVQLGTLVKSSSSISLSGGIISVNETGWYKISFNGRVEQTLGTSNRYVIRMGFYCIQDNSIDNNIFWGACYLRGNNGLNANNLTRFGYINNSGITYLSSNKGYRLIVEGALGGADFGSGLNNVYLNQANLQIEKMV